MQANKKNKWGFLFYDALDNYDYQLRGPMWKIPYRGPFKFIVYRTAQVAGGVGMPRHRTCSLRLGCNRQPFLPYSIRTAVEIQRSRHVTTEHRMHAGPPAAPTWQEDKDALKRKPNMRTALWMPVPQTVRTGMTTRTECTLTLRQQKKMHMATKDGFGLSFSPSTLWLYRTTKVKSQPISNISVTIARCFSPSLKRGSST